MNDHKQGLVKIDCKYHFLKKLILISSLPLSFIELVFIFVSNYEQKNWAFDRNKRGTEIYHSFESSLDSLSIENWSENGKRIRLAFCFSTFKCTLNLSKIAKDDTKPSNGSIDIENILEWKKKHFKPRLRCLPTYLC